MPEYFQGGRTTHQIVAKLERFGSHDAVEEGGELKFGANWATAGTSLNLATFTG